MNRIEIIIPLEDLVKVKRKFYWTLEDTWENYCLEQLRKAGAPIKKSFLGRMAVIERGNVFREDLIEKKAIKMTWEENNGESLQN